MAMLAKIRRMYFRDQLSIREITRRTGLSRNTIREWLRQEDAVEPVYPKRVNPSKLNPYKEQLLAWLRADSQRPRRDRRTAKVMFALIQARGYPGGYGRVVEFVRHWRAADAAKPQRQAYVPMQFVPGEAFQFDWSCEYAVIAGQRQRLEVAHLKLASSRVFWLVAYPNQRHEMVFDAHTRGFTAFGGVPRRGIYDNMKTAVDAVGRGKSRTVNIRFQAMCSHYLFEPEFCNRAAGWEKGIVEKNVQDRRRQLWQGVLNRHWSSLVELNDWLATECRAAWQDMRHPEQPEITLQDALDLERPHLMPLPKPFDGYIEQSVRVSPTALITFERNRYSVPVDYAHKVVSLHIYPTELVVVHEEQCVAQHTRCFAKHQVCYDWQHYIPAIARKPGALRNGAPFTTMPEVFRLLQKQLLRHAGGDRVMAQVLSAVPVHGVEAVQVAIELALESGHVSGEHVLNILARLKAPTVPMEPLRLPVLRLYEEPEANVQRYDRLWQVDSPHRVTVIETEVPHVD